MTELRIALSRKYRCPKGHETENANWQSWNFGLRTEHLVCVVCFLEWQSATFPTTEKEESDDR